MHLQGINLKEKFTQFAEENGKGYIKPLVTGIGTGLNTGFYNTAKVLGPFKFGVSLNGMMIFIPDEDKTFQAVSPSVTYEGTDYYLYDPAETETATIFGGDGAQWALNPALDDYDEFTGVIPKTLPNGGDLSWIPFFFPQVNVGLPYGNEIMLRIFPSMEVHESAGEIGFYGFGLKHSLDQYLPGILPIDIAVQGVYQYAKISDVIELRDMAVNAQVSKKLLMWTIYGGIGWENTRLKADYETDYYNYQTMSYEKIPIKFEIEGENDFRATVGFRYSILLLKLWADYTICKYPVLNMGLGLSL